MGKVYEIGDTTEVTINEFEDVVVKRNYSIEQLKARVVELKTELEKVELLLQEAEKLGIQTK